MKRDEVRSLIEGITDEQLDAIMKMNGDSVNAEKLKATNLQKQLDEANKKIDALSEESKAKDEASMTLEERIKAMEDSYAAKERDLAVEKNTLAAEKILTSAGLADTDYAPLMSSIVSDNLDATIANANAVSALVSAQREAATTIAKQSLMEQTPPPGGSGNASATTKEQFAAMSYQERLSLYNESPEVYNELVNN